MDYRGTLVQNLSLVIMFKLRDHRIAKFDTIDEFIYCTTGHASFASEALQDIHSCHGRNTLLLLESWDERHDNQQHNLFLTNIVTDKLLKMAVFLLPVVRYHTKISCDQKYCYIGIF